MRSGTAVKRIAVFRALNLGDMLCAMPALRALRKAFPDAHITLIGLPSARPLMPYLSPYLDELTEFPGHPAFPEQAVHQSLLFDFYQAMREREFDLVLQMHGSGPQSNQIVRAFEPRSVAGFVPEPAQVVPGQYMLWPDQLNEIHRYLALLMYLGIEVDDDTLHLPLSKNDRDQAEELISHFRLKTDRLVLMHPGARLASRRWPIERYGDVARVLVEAGWQLAVTGGKNEQFLSHTLVHSGLPVVDLCGKTSLGGLAALLDRARLLICNDTGVSHVAASVRCRSVVVACGSDVVRWRPLDTSRHRVLYRSMHCRPCAWDVCPFGHACARELDVKDVVTAVFEQLRCFTL